MDNFFYLTTVVGDAIDDVFPNSFGIKKMTVASKRFLSDIDCVKSAKSILDKFEIVGESTVKFDSEFFPVDNDEEGLWKNFDDENAIKSIATFDKVDNDSKLLIDVYIIRNKEVLTSEDPVIPNHTVLH